MMLTSVLCFSYTQSTRQINNEFEYVYVFSVHPGANPDLSQHKMVVSLTLSIHTSYKLEKHIEQVLRMCTNINTKFVFKAGGVYA